MDAKTACTLALLLGTSIPAQEPAAPSTAPLAGLDLDAFDAAAFDALVAAGDRLLPALIEIAHDASHDSPVEQRRHERAHAVLRSLTGDAARAAVREFSALGSDGPRAFVLKRGAGPVTIRSSDAFDSECARTLAALAVTAHCCGDVSLADLVEAATHSTRLSGVQAFTVEEAIAPGQRLEFTVQFRSGSRPAPSPSARRRIRIFASELWRTGTAERIAALDDDEPYVRELAAILLGRGGDASPPVLEALRTAAQRLDHPTVTGRGALALSGSFGEGIRCAAAIALARLAPREPEARRVLVLLLRADHPLERVLAVMELGRADDRAVPGIVPALLEACADDDPLVGAEAITALGRVGVARDEVLTSLRGFAKGSDARAARATAALRRHERAR